jgi:hypothetical protein
MAIPVIDQLRRALNISENIERLQSELASLLGQGTALVSSVVTPARSPGRKRRKMSPAARAKIAEAQRRRWAKQKGKGARRKKATSSKAAAPKRKRQGGITPAGRAKLAAMMKARWAARKKGAAAPNARR